jgi:hypothetical protein
MATNIPVPTDAELLCLMEAHLGLKPRRDDTVIDPHTGRFTDAQRYRDFARAVLARWGAQPAPADSVLEDAARWQALPAFFEEYQIDAMKLYRDIDAYLAAARKQGGAT